MLCEVDGVATRAAAEVDCPARQDLPALDKMDELVAGALLPRHAEEAIANFVERLHCASSHYPRLGGRRNTHQRPNRIRIMHVKIAKKPMSSTAANVFTRPRVASYSAADFAVFKRLISGSKMNSINVWSRMAP